MTSPISPAFVHFHAEQGRVLEKDTAEQIADLFLWFIRDRSVSAEQNAWQPNLIQFEQTQNYDGWLWYGWAFLGCTVFLLFTLIGYIALQFSETHLNSFRCYDNLQLNGWKDHAQQLRNPEEIGRHLQQGIDHFSTQQMVQAIHDTSAYRPLIQLFEVEGPSTRLSALLLAIVQDPEAAVNLVKGCESIPALQSLIDLLSDYPSILMAALLEQFSHANYHLYYCGLDYLLAQIGQNAVRAIIAKSPDLLADRYLNCLQVHHYNMVGFLQSLKDVADREKLLFSQWQDYMTLEKMRMAVAVQDQFADLAKTVNSNYRNEQFYEFLVEVLNERLYAQHLEKLAQVQFSKEAMLQIVYAWTKKPSQIEALIAFYDLLQKNQNDAAAKIASTCALWFALKAPFPGLFRPVDHVIQGNLSPDQIAGCQKLVDHIFAQEQDLATLQSWLLSNDAQEDYVNALSYDREKLLEACKPFPILKQLIETKFPSTLGTL